MECYVFHKPLSELERLERSTMQHLENMGKARQVVPSVQTQAGNGKFQYGNSKQVTIP